MRELKNFWYILFFKKNNNLLTNLSTAPFLGDIGNQRRTRSDAANRGVWSGSALFTYLLYF